MIYKKYILDHPEDQNTLTIAVWSLCVVPGSQLPNPWDFLSVRSHGTSFCHSV